MLRCRVLGYRYRFTTSGNEMRWRCQRGCGAGGAKRYPTAADARRYAPPSTARTATTWAVVPRWSRCYRYASLG